MECIMLFNVRHLDLKVLEALQILVLPLTVLLRNGEVSVPP